MTIIIGGLRARLIHDSLVGALQTDLADLGWFDSGRQHLRLRFDAGPRLWDDPVKANALVVTTQGADFDFVEVGSNFGMNTSHVMIDLYAESDSFGMDLTNDIRDILRGRIGSMIRRGQLPILDYQQATPAPIAHATVSDVSVSRNTALAQRDYARHIYQIQCRLEDTYYAESSGS